MILTNPLFLIGLVAVGIPIAVHLFNFRRYRKVYFSNVERLQELQQETRRQSRLREYLILLCRILFVVFMVLAFAQPVISRRSQSVHRGGSVISVYVDNSYSMENTGRDGQLLETAKQKAREIVAAYKPGDRYQLLTNEASGREFRWLSREEFLTALEEVEPVPSTVFMSTMAQRQHDFLHSSSAVNMYAYVVSDFQKTTSDLAMMPRDTMIRTTLVPLEGSQTANVYIDTMTLSAPVCYQGNTITAKVTVVNTGDEAVEKVPVRLYVNNKERAIATVDLSAEGRATVDLSFVVDCGGVLDGRIEISDYPITFDDRLYFVLNVRDKIRALEIDGGQKNEYLSKLYENDSALTFQTMSLGQMDYGQVSKQDYIILNELPEIPTGLGQALIAFVKDGGTLTVIPSETSEVDGYSQMLAQFKAPRLAQWRKTPAKVSKMNAESSLYRNVFEGNNESLELPKVTGYFKMVADGGVARESLMALENGDDYLVQTQMGGGRLFLFAVPMRLEMTDFVQQALFVPTLFNMALYSRPAGVPYSVLGDGRPILLNTREVGEVSRLVDQDGKVDLIPDIRRREGRYYLVMHDQIKASGCYRLKTSAGEEGIAFNYSRFESDLDYYERGEVLRMVKGQHLEEYEVIKTPEKSLEAIIKAQNDGVSLWRWCLVLALLALLAEMIVVRWSGFFRKE